MRHSLAEHELIEAMNANALNEIQVMNLGKEVQSQSWFCRQILMH